MKSNDMLGADPSDALHCDFSSCLPWSDGESGRTNMVVWSIQRELKSSVVFSGISLDQGPGAASSVRIWVDGQCVGRTSGGAGRLHNLGGKVVPAWTARPISSSLRRALFTMICERLYEDTKQ